MLTLTGFEFVKQGARYRLGRDNARELVGQDGPNESRSEFIRTGLNGGQSADGLNDGVVNRLVGKGSCFAKSRNRDINNL